MTKKYHYYEDRKTIVPVCGTITAPCGYDAPINDVTCTLCRQTEIFKQDLISFEIGYECDLNKWFDYFDNRQT